MTNRNVALAWLRSGTQIPEFELRLEIAELLEADAAEIAKLKPKAEDHDLANAALAAIREACNQIMGGNCAYVDDDFARCLFTLRDRNAELEALVREVVEWHAQPRVAVKVDVWNVPQVARMLDELNAIAIRASSLLEGATKP